MLEIPPYLEVKLTRRIEILRILHVERHLKRSVYLEIGIRCRCYVFWNLSWP